MRGAVDPAALLEPHRGDANLLSWAELLRLLAGKAQCHRVAIDRPLNERFVPGRSSGRSFDCQSPEGMEVRCHLDTYALSVGSGWIISESDGLSGLLWASAG